MIVEINVLFPLPFRIVCPALIMLPQGGSLVCYSDSDSSSSTSSSDIEVIDASSELSEESDEESTDETKPFNVKDAVNGIIDKLISKALKQASLRKRFQRCETALPSSWGCSRGPISCLL